METSITIMIWILGIPTALLILAKTISVLSNIDDRRKNNSQ